LLATDPVEAECTGSLAHLGSARTQLVDAIAVRGVVGGGAVSRAFMDRPVDLAAHRNTA